MSGHWARGYLGLAGADQNGGNGGGGGAMVLTVTKTTEDDVEIYTLDATYAQVKAALRAGTEVYFVDDMETEVVKYTLDACEDAGTHDHDPNLAFFHSGSNGTTFAANAEDDLLTANMG